MEDSADGSSGNKDPAPDEELPERTGHGSARTVTAFWILGLCNNFIYVIMLSAAHDVIHKVEAGDRSLDNETTNGRAPFLEHVEGRNCTDLTTGAILLADIVPTLIVKLFCPFLPFFVHVRILSAVTTGIISLILVATSESVTLAIIGVCFASFNSGLGEITLLAYSTKFMLHAIAAWSSGTGGAGLAGSFAYAGMTESGFTPELSLLICISVPLLMAISFWGILKHPITNTNRFASGVADNGEPVRKLTVAMIQKEIKDKIFFIPKLVTFMVPVGLVYYFEYLINSGLFDKFEYENTILSKSSQFRWFNVLYQVGVFISRTSVTWVHFRHIWIMSLLQGINFIVFFLESIYGFIPNVWCIFILIFWEGLLGGAAYANTFYNMSYMINKEQRLFALSIASVADTLGIVLSGITTFPLHEFICRLPFKPAFRWP